MMRNFRINKWIVLTVAVLSIILFDFIYLSKKTETVIDGVCNAAFEVTHNHVGLVLPLNATMIFRPDLTGLIELSGSTAINGKPVRLSRVISFNYSQENGNVFKLADIAVESHAGDTFNDDFFNRYFFSINAEHTRYITLTRLYNTLIVGNAYSPIFICVEKP